MHCLQTLLENTHYMRIHISFEFILLANTHYFWIYFNWKHWYYLRTLTYTCKHSSYFWTLILLANIHIICEYSNYLQTLITCASVFSIETKKQKKQMFKNRRDLPLSANTLQVTGKCSRISNDNVISSHVRGRFSCDFRSRDREVEWLSATYRPIDLYRYCSTYRDCNFSNVF